MVSSSSGEGGIAKQGEGEWEPAPEVQRFKVGDRVEWRDFNYRGVVIEATDTLVRVRFDDGVTQTYAQSHKMLRLLDPPTPPATVEGDGPWIIHENADGSTFLHNPTLAWNDVRTFEVPRNNIAWLRDILNKQHAENARFQNALHKIAYGHFGNPEASHAEVLDSITEYARLVLNGGVK
jgi:hypothetical protein